MCDVEKMSFALVDSCYLDFFRGLFYRRRRGVSFVECVYILTGHGAILFV